MKVSEFQTSQLAAMAAPYNPRQITDKDLAALQRSMRYFGVVEPVVVNMRSGHIVGGHQRVKAARAEGIKSLPVVEVDLDEPSEKQLNLALNRIHGDWDEDKLAVVLAELQESGADLDLTGFESHEIDRYLASIEETPLDGLTDPDAVPEPPDDPITQPGELIILGEHRLLCGDSTNADDVKRLLDGADIHLVNTDPPYNVKVEPRSNNAIAAARASGSRQKHHQKFDLARHKSKDKPTGKMRPRDRELVNDFLPDEEFRKLLQAWFKNLSAALLPGRGFYLWGGYSNFKNYPAAIEAAGLYFSQCVVWHKQWPVLTRKDFMGDHEWCFYGWREGAAHYFNPAIHNATDVWTVKKVSPPSMIHLTEKPVELAERALTYSSKKGENVLDLFAGSGSTLMAAERLERRVFLMEIDAAYCDVIVQRWEAFTGEKVVRERAA